LPCNLCGSVDVIVLSLTDRSGRYLRTVICEKCGLIWTDPRPSGKDIRGFYSDRYRKEYKGSSNPALKHLYRDVHEACRRYRFISRFVKKEDSILDIGSGTGVFMYVLRSLGFTVCGLEPDRHYGEYSAGKFGLPVKISFFQDAEFEGAFNFVSMHHVLEHTEDPLGILKKIRGLLASSGHLYIGVPNAEDISQAPRNRYHKAHLYTFNGETIRVMSEKAGFIARRMSINPFNGDIALILQKHENFEPVTGIIPGNCGRIVRILDRNNFLRHFTTSFPYRKFAGNIARPLKEKRELKKYSDECGMLDAVIRENKLSRV